MKRTAKIKKARKREKNTTPTLDFNKIAAIGQMMSAMAAYRTGTMPPEVKIYVVRDESEIPEERK